MWRKLAAEDPGSDTVDDNAHSGRPDDEGAVDIGGMHKLVDTLHDDGADGHQQDDGVEERDENRGLAVSVGEAAGGVAGGELEGNHGQQEREDVAQVVARVGEEAQGIADKAGDGFDNDKGQVECHRHYINSRELLDGVGMVMMVVTMMVVMMVLFV